MTRTGNAGAPGRRLPRGGAVAARARRFVGRYGLDYLFISPFFILYAAFGIYPLLYSITLSFHQWAGAGAWEWVGLANYADYVFKDELFGKVLGNTLVYWAILIPVMTLLALVLAVLLNQPHLRLIGFFRTVYVLPYIVSIVAVAIIFLNLLDDNVGWINYFLTQLGLERVKWLGSTAWSKTSVVILVVWKWVGYNMLIMLAGLQSVPDEIYEAAMIDGAGATRRFFSMTVPLMRPVILFAMVLTTIGTFNMFAEPFILTDGGPRNSSDTLGTLLYRTAFRFGRFGAAAALSVIIAVLVLGFSLAQFRSLERRK